MRDAVVTSSSRELPSAATAPPPPPPPPLLLSLQGQPWHAIGAGVRAATAVGAGPAWPSVPAAATAVLCAAPAPRFGPFSRHLAQPGPLRSSYVDSASTNAFTQNASAESVSVGTAPQRSRSPPRWQRGTYDGKDVAFCSDIRAQAAAATAAVPALPLHLSTAFNSPPRIDKHRPLHDLEVRTRCTCVQNFHSR